MIQFLVTQELNGGTVRYLYADYSARVRKLAFASNNRGLAECSGFVPMGLHESFALYDAVGALRAQVVDASSGSVYDGRIEDVALVDGGVELTALGYARAVSDAPYTALWSTTSVGAFVPVKDTDFLQYSFAARSVWDTNNRLFIGPVKNGVFNAAGDGAVLAFTGPDQGTRQIIGVSFDYSNVLPANMQAFLGRFTSAWGYVAAPWVLTGTAALQTGTIHVTFASTDRIAFGYQTTAGPITHAGEDGADYLKITNLRIVTSTTNRVNTTLGTNIAAGTRTVTPGSMARIFVGQSLQIDQGSVTVAESVVVTAITSTTFTAVFAFAHVIASTVNAFVIYADEIAKDLVSVTSTLNPGQLSSSTSLISSPALDLQNEVYEDQLPSDILDYLVGIGDTSGNQWEWGVRDSQRLYFRQQGTASRTWYIDVSALDIQRLLDQLWNSVYAVYQDASGRSLRTAVTSDAGSVARYQLTRRQALSVQTTSATQAGLQQAAALNDGADPKPRSGVTISQIFDASGSRWPLYAVAAGDTVVIRNLSPTLSTTIDRIRVFRLARVAYDIDRDTLSLEPETPRPTLEALLAQVAAGVR